MKSMQGSSQAGRSGRPSPAAPSAITFSIPTRHSKNCRSRLPAGNAVPSTIRADGQWGQKPARAHEDLCPACRRFNEGLPAGIVTLHGAITPSRKDEVIGLARNEEDAEKGEHPLNCIFNIEDTAEGLVISTTDIHLPRRIGEALKRAFRGKLDMHFDEAGYFVRVDWRPSA